MTRAIGLIGRGAIGTALKRLLEADGHVVTVLVRGQPMDGEAAALADLLAARPLAVVEAAGRQALAQHGPGVLRAGVALVAASVGALADDALLEELRSAARAGDARLHLPSGAVGGIDALAALPEATLSYRGAKPPHAWPAGTPEGVFFEGTAREAASRYPKNANVAATLALAGPGLDATTVTLTSDPAATGNVHEWTAQGAGTRLEVRIENAATPGNAATSALTVHSLHRVVRNLTSEIAL